MHETDKCAKIFLHISNLFIICLHGQSFFNKGGLIIGWAHCGIFENGVLFMYTIEDVSSVANFITAYEESQ